jgi:hypothetical protein
MLNFPARLRLATVGGLRFLFPAMRGPTFPLYVISRRCRHFLILHKYFKMTYERWLCFGSCVSIHRAAIQFFVVWNIKSLLFTATEQKVNLMIFYRVN